MTTKTFAIIALTFLISVSATVGIPKVVSQPAIPKRVIVKYFYIPEDIPNFVKKLSKKGYILKEIEAENSRWLITLEKY